MNNVYNTNNLQEFLKKNPSIPDGSTIKLSPGYHGIPTISYDAKTQISIVGCEGALVGALYFSGATRIIVSLLEISRSIIPKNDPSLTIKIDGVTFDGSTTFCTVQDCILYTTKALPDSLSIKQWKSMGRSGFSVYGQNNTILRNHCKIGGNIQIHYGAHKTRAAYNTIENFCSDGSGVRGSECIFEYNTIKNCYKIDGNHNDLCQNWGGSNNIFRGNTFISNENPDQPFLAKPGISDVQALAKFDQNSNGILIENNLILASHPIGIWWLGTSNSIIRYNTVLQVGSKTYFNNRPPTISTWPSKSKYSGKGNQIYGNLCQTIECQDGVSVKDSNILIKTSEFSELFKDWSKQDLHLLKEVPSKAKGIPPTIDKDGNPRNVESPCAGCYEFQKPVVELMISDPALEDIL